MDGKPFRYVSGSIHYFRVPHQYWRDRLRKIRAAGLNAISTYIEWSQHEPAPGQYNFEGDLNITRFIQIAHEEGLYVLLRPGPYICAERDMGGLPYWLLTKNPHVNLRSSDPRYTEYVEKWMNVLLPMLSPLLYGNGGPIIMVQVENEYGSYYTCDEKYKTWLRDLFKRHIHDNAVLYTTDGAGDEYLKCGKIPEVYATVDFGPGGDTKRAFAPMRKTEPKGPLVNSELYSGWLDHWGHKMERVNYRVVVKTLREILKMRANANIYMFFGGTNFGFTAGANMFRSYQPDITSYDYDAPITEAGDLTEKYFAIKRVLSEFLPPSNISVKTHDKADYGEFTLRSVATMMSPFVRKSLGVMHTGKYPLSFEALGQNYGYLLYETHLKKNSNNPVRYSVKSFHDYMNVYVDGKFITSLTREKKLNKFKLEKTSRNQVLSLIVENLGRINYGSELADAKGILSNVTRKDKPLDTWNMTSFELKTLKPIEKCFTSNAPDCHNGHGFRIFATSFVIPANASTGEEKFLLDSYLDVRNLTKGLVFVNDFNLGRYWSTRGPQYTLYVPGVYLKPNPQANTLVVIDENLRNETVTLKFTKSPSFSIRKRSHEFFCR